MNEEPIPFPLPANHPLKANPGTKPLKLFVKEVLETVSLNRGIDVSEIRSRRRFAPTAFARQIAMFIVRKNRKESWMQISRAFDRDHGTVMHACKAVRDVMDTVPSERESVQAILRKLNLPVVR
jgi:chromosomal replication initiator protein